MTRHRSLTSTLYRAARLSNNIRAARGGPASYARRVVRRKVYRREGTLTRKVFKGLGL
jgi:hypothetical protein